MPNAPAPATGPLSKLAWLSGAWVKTAADKVSEETWTTPSRDTMFGSNRTFKASKMVAFEFLLLRSTPDGIFYRAWPGGKNPASFKLIRSGTASATFENKAHDFPQRIIYRRSDETLHARIEGEIDGKAKSLQWVWQRRTR